MSLLISSCATVIPNVEICHDRNTTAHCTKIVTRESREDLNWGINRLGRFSISAEHWGDMKIFIESVCERTKCSTDAIKKTLEKIESKESD